MLPFWRHSSERKHIVFNPPAIFFLKCYELKPATRMFWSSLFTLANTARNIFLDVRLSVRLSKHVKFVQNTRDIFEQNSVCMCLALIKTSVRRAKLMHKLQNKLVSIARAHECMFLGASQTKECLLLSTSAAGESDENFNDFGDVHLENSVHVPHQRSSGEGCTTPSNDLRGYCAPSDPARGSRLTPSDTSRGP